MAVNFLTTDAIDSYYRGMKEPVNAEITQAGNDYKAALDRLQQMKEQQDAENYRSYVRQQTEIPGLMRAAGNNGGMVDSAVASLANAYNQARAKRSLEYETNRANQDLDYNNRLAELRAKLTQYDQLAAADRANLLAQQEAEAAALAASRARSSSGRSSSGKGSSDEEAITTLQSGGSVTNPSTPVTRDTTSGGSTVNSGGTSKFRNEVSLYDRYTPTAKSNSGGSSTSMTSKRLPSVKA